MTTNKKMIENALKNQGGTTVIEQAMGLNRKIKANEHYAPMMIETWLDEKTIDMKTELNQNQVNAVSIFKTLGMQFKILPLLNLLKNFLTYMLSKDRGSSTELVEMLKGGVQESDDVTPTIKRFFG